MSKLHHLWKQFISTLKDTVFNKQVMSQAVQTMDIIQASFVWLLILVCIIGALIMVGQSISNMIHGEVFISLAAAVLAILMLIIILLADRYMHGPTTDRGGENL